MTPTWLMTKMFGGNWNETRLDGESPTENRRDSWIHWKGIRSKSQADFPWKDSRLHQNTYSVSRNGHPWNKREKPKGIPTNKSNEIILSGEEKLHYYSDAHWFTAGSEEEAEIASCPQQGIAGIRSVRYSNKYLIRLNAAAGQLGLGAIVSLFPVALTSTPTTQTTLKINYDRLPLFFDFESVNQSVFNTNRKILKIASVILSWRN